MNQLLLTDSLLGNRTLRLIEGDITEEDVDAIVNAANEMLVHGGGLAGTIALKGGPVVQDESRTWVEKHGYVPAGTSAITGSGDLKARYVIHAVGPVWVDGTRSEETELFSAIRSAMILADEHRLRSIAIPAISTGIFGYPKHLAAPVIVRAIVTYFDERPDSTLVDIRICDKSPANTACLMYELEALNRPESSASA